MNLETSLSIIHIFIGLMQFTAAVFAYLSNRKHLSNQVIAGLLLLLGLTSFAVGFEINALTPAQALPWVAVELFSVYSAATATLFVAILLFFPKAGENAAFRIAGPALIVVPLLLLILDLLDQSTTLVGTHFLINLSEFFDTYSVGYINIDQAATGPIHVGLFWLRNIVYSVLVFFPLLFVIWRDRKIKSRFKTQAALLLGATIISAVTNTILLNYLPQTLPSLIANLAFTIALTVIAIMNSEAITSRGRAFDFLQNMPMFYKLISIVVGLVLPSILFIAFSIYSFGQNGLLENSSGYLRNFAASKSLTFSAEVDDYLHELLHLSEGEELENILADHFQVYQGMSIDQIRSSINTAESSGGYLDAFNTPAQARINQPLIDLRSGFPTAADIILVDQYGALVATTKPPARYDYSTAAWFLSATSRQAPFIGSPIWNSAAGSYAIEIAVPVFDEQRNLRGAFGTTYLLDHFFTGMSAQQDLEVYYGINIDNAELITNENTQNSRFELPVWFRESSANPREWNVVPGKDGHILIESVPVASEEAGGLLDWQLSAFLPLEVSLATLYSSRSVLIGVVGSIAIIATLASVFLARGISQPLVSLTEAARRVLDGNLDVDIDIAGEDELGILGATFSQMTDNLSGMVENLETTVENRTRDLQRRTLQMETSAQVARQAAEIRDLQTLLNESVKLVSERFGFYHAGIFLLDTAGRYAVLQAANSPGGQRMLARGHRLQVGKVGVVGYCAGTGLPRISQDVGADIVYYDNPDMPRTRSELALPLRVRNTIIGVLDVQSTEASAFSQEDIDVLQILADQIALAIDNVRLLQSSQRALDELQRLYGQQAGQAWRQKLIGQPIAYQYTPTGLEGGEHKVAISMENRPGHRLHKDIRFRGQSIGKLNLLRETEEGGWSEDEQALIDEILEQTALALENARLVDQIRLRSDQIQLLQEVSAVATEVLDEERLLPILAEKLQSSLDVDHCGVVLLDTETAFLTVSVGSLENQPKIGTSIVIEEDVITQRLVRNKEVDLFTKVQEDPRMKAFIQAFASPLANTIIFLPIIVREETAGFFYLEDTKPERDTDSEEIKLFNQLSTQISTALENIRLFDETVNRAERERQVAEITAKIRSSNDPQEILQVAVAELKKALNTYTEEPQEEIKSSAPAQTKNGKDAV